MPTKTYVHPFTPGAESPKAVDFKTYAIRRRLPAYRVCPDPKPPFYLFGADAWNCAKCSSEKPFYLPVVTGDKFEFQFQFEDDVNPDPTAPAFGWRESTSGANEYYIAARILDCNCAPVDDLGHVDLLAEDWGVAYTDPGGSYQWFRLDMGLLPVELCCFNIQVVKYSLVEGIATEDILITAGPYARADSATCSLCESETVLISGRWKKADCWGRRFDIGFGVGSALFTDSVRLNGFISYIGTAPEVVFDDEIEVKTSLRSKYRFTLKGVPPLVAQWISTVLSSNSYLSIGGHEITRSKGDVVAGFERENLNTQLVYGTIDFSTVCEIENFGCS